MKASVYVCFFLLLLLSLCGCKSKEEIVRLDSNGEPIDLRPNKPRDYITKKLNLYEVKAPLYPILDSIIIKSEKCHESHVNKEKTAFVLVLTPANDSIPLRFTIVSICFPRTYLYEWINALFYYKGYSFYYDGELFDPFLRKTDERRSISCISTKKYQFEYYVKHDRGLNIYWRYEYVDNQITNTSYGNCCKKEE